MTSVSFWCASLIRYLTRCGPNSTTNLLLQVPIGRGAPPQNSVVSVFMSKLWHVSAQSNIAVPHQQHSMFISLSCILLACSRAWRTANSVLTCTAVWAISVIYTWCQITSLIYPPTSGSSCLGQLAKKQITWQQCSEACPSMKSCSYIHTVWPPSARSGLDLVCSCVDSV
jgi:hypothetical protein